MTLVHSAADPSTWLERLAVYELQPVEAVSEISPNAPSDRLYVFAGGATEADLPAVRRVLRNGGAVLAALPRSAGAEEFVAQAVREGFLGLFVLTPSVYTPACLEARRLLADGTVGALRLLRHETPLDDSQALFHRVSTVAALCAPRWPGGPVRVSAAGSGVWRLALEGGAAAELAAGPAGASGGHAACTRGDVRYSLSPPGAVEWRLHDGTGGRGALPDGDGALYQLLDAVESWAEGRASRIWPPAMALRAYELCEALRRKGYPE